MAAFIDVLFVLALTAPPAVLLATVLVVLLTPRRQVPAEAAARQHAA